MPLLVVTTPETILTDGDMIDASPKTVSGMLELSKGWPGDFLWLAHARHVEQLPHGTALSHLPVEITTTDDRLATLETLKPDLLHATLAKSELPILEQHAPRTVMLAENSLSGRLQWAVEASPSRRISLRHRAGLARLEWRYRRALRSAAGIQCNGLPSWNSYHRLNPDSLLFYDSRISASVIPDGQSVTEQGPASTFAFSGRWLRPKGFIDALEAFDLAATRADHELILKIFGAGELADRIPNRNDIEVRGNLDFETQWIPEVRTSVDVMLLPHRQPDPACTYLEAAGLGAPFLSYDNAAATQLADRFGIGAVAPMGSTAALADLIVRASTDSDWVHSMRLRSIEFMSSHSFEKEFARRASHFAQCHARQSACR